MAVSVYRMRKIMQSEIIFDFFLLSVDGIKGFIAFSVYRMRKSARNDITFDVFLSFVDAQLIIDG